MGKKQSSAQDSDIISTALEFATRIHEGTFRKSGEPYINHPIAVKKILDGHGFSDLVLVAALLHDVLEDTSEFDKTEKELFEIFGDEVFFLVQAVSKDNRITDKTERDNKYHQQIITAMQRDPAVIFIKAADLLHNVSTLKYLSQKSQDRWIQELKEFYLLNFTKNFHIIPPFQRDLYHQLMDKLQEVIDHHEKDPEKQS